MKISGFTMVRNATKLYYPVKESILSILPLVDEFVIALGNCDEDDHTLAEIQSIQSEKIKIIHTTWNTLQYANGSEYAHQTNIAKAYCSGDWLFYLQSDEVIHEKYLPVIHERCRELLHNTSVEGLLFEYVHFWGDYKHYLQSHAWYANEIRIVRNLPDIHSWRDAQSFRRIPKFDGKDFFQKEGSFKLKVAKVDAKVFHYGWVRPPHYMQTKYKSFIRDYKGDRMNDSLAEYKATEFDYGSLDKLTPFKGSHPLVMREMIDRFNWQEKLDRNPGRYMREKHKHERFKNRILSFFEKKFLNGKQIFTFKNYELLDV
ncbi:MAG: glycosyltransferase family 2 protein [Chitinophagaceae bacterium]|nr:glycosyltransferase family 2 protein [Chitinophagaceae bacterium]